MNRLSPTQSLGGRIESRADQVVGPLLPVARSWSAAAGAHLMGVGRDRGRKGKTLRHLAAGG